jgi:hypothetical protein
MASLSNHEVARSILPEITEALTMLGYTKKIEQ